MTADRTGLVVTPMSGNRPDRNGDPRSRAAHGAAQDQHPRLRRRMDQQQECAERGKNTRPQNARPHG